MSVTSDKTVIQEQKAQVQALLNAFKLYCEKAKVQVEENNPAFRTVERFYWLGVMDGLKLTNGKDKLPEDIYSLVFWGDSPLLSYAPKQTRVRKPKLVKKEGTDGGEPAAAA